MCLFFLIVVYNSAPWVQTCVLWVASTQAVCTYLSRGLFTYLYMYFCMYSPCINRNMSNKLMWSWSFHVHMFHSHASPISKLSLTLIHLYFVMVWIVYTYTRFLKWRWVHAKWGRHLRKFYIDIQFPHILICHTTYQQHVYMIAYCVFALSCHTIPQLYIWYVHVHEITGNNAIGKRKKVYSG